MAQAHHCLRPLGNSMARPILQRLSHRILKGWQLLDGHDPWESGIAQQALRRDTLASGNMAATQACPSLMPAKPALARVFEVLS